METKKEQRDLKSLMDDVCKDLVSPYVRQKERIFVDIEALYDFKLGALLALTSEKEYPYILEHLPEYTGARDLEIMKYFPDLDFTEETIEKFMQDEKHRTMLSLLAPPLSLLEDFRDMIAGINTYNTSKESHEPLKITINQSTFQIDDIAKARLIEYITSIDPHITVDFVSYQWSEIPKEILAKQDILIIYDIVSFVAADSKFVDCCREGLLGKTTIATFMQVTNHNCDEGEAIANFSATMNIFCNNFLVLEKELLIGNPE